LRLIGENLRRLTDRASGTSSSEQRIRRCSERDWGLPDALGYGKVLAQTRLRFFSGSKQNYGASQSLEGNTALMIFTCHEFSVRKVKSDVSSSLGNATNGDHHCKDDYPSESVGQGSAKEKQNTQQRHVEPPTIEALIR
jgi:hypothetical protein